MNEENDNKIKIINSDEFSSPNNNNKNKLALICIIIIGLLIIGVGLYICYDKGIIFDKENNSSTSKSSEKKSDKDDNSQKSNDIKNDDELNLKIEKNGIVVKTLADDEYGYNLYINDKLIENIGYISKNSIYILDDIVIAAGSDTDIRSTKLNIYDKDGNKILSVYENFDGPSMMIKEYSDNEQFHISNNEIIFKADIFGYEELYDDNGNQISNELYCKTSNYDDLNASGLYKIRYLGNGKVSAVENISYTKLKDIKSEIGCDLNN